MLKIAQEIHKIEELESDLLAKEKEVEKDVLWLKKADIHRRRVVKRLAKHKFVFSTLVTFAIVLIWRGLWSVADMMPVIKDTGASLILGFGILWFLEKYSDG